MNRNGTQRYRCQHCERYFTPKPEENWHDQQRRIEVQWRAVKLYLDGRSLRSIAKQLGVHHQTVGRWVAVWTKDFQTVLQAIVTMACLYQFLQTKDAVWVLTAYALASGSASLPIERTLLSNKKEHLQKEDKF